MRLLFLVYFLIYIFEVFCQNKSLYNVSYLRKLEKIEEISIIDKYVNIGMNYIKNMMITYAKNGYSEISLMDCNEIKLIDFNNNIYNELTPKDYNYLKPIILENIEKNIKEELCNDCIINKKQINNCTKYTLLW